jgi:hypothetical protein
VMKPEDPERTGSNRDSDPTPARGDLGIKEKRSWKTWQLLVGVAAAALIGMAINYRTVGASQSSSTKGAYTLPAPSGSATTTTGASTTGSDVGTTTTAASTSGSEAGTSTTTSGGSSTSSSTTTSSVAPTPARLLLGPTQSQGNWTSTAFTTTSPGWNIGWAFACPAAPPSGASFQISVTPVGSSPSGAPAISETGASGQAVSAQSAVGQQTLAVVAAPSCTWAIKVTGS